MNETIKGTEAMARRAIDAEDNFYETVMNISGCSIEGAEKVLREYVKAKAVKRDIVGGRYHVTHGVFFDADVIRNAINL